MKKELIKISAKLEEANNKKNSVKDHIDLKAEQEFVE